jgi:glycosyltransferase involved in cell wall biosynthesis
VIYSQLSTLELIRFVSEVQLATNKPLVIHIMDDWPSKISQPGIFYHYWKRRINKEFRNLLNKSSALMSICEAMSEEYKERYGKDFIPFHNPIEIDNWLPFARTQWNLEKTFTILYAGRVGRGIMNSIVQMGIVVNNLHKSGVNVAFEIQSPDNDKLANLLEANDCIKFVNPIAYSELPKKFSSADLLFLPEDFDSDSVEFLKFSIQTKVAEYMISGTPILVFANKKTALAKYALQDDWALAVTENKRSTLTTALNELINNRELRRQLSAKAKEIAIKNEDAAVVRTNFRKVLSKL